ncbi:amidase family protein [Shewanella waksmanii]|uniref:amidase family protein n=1 Tax=Shewanella waksmanii TaxID=213783 RepID=UPI003736CCE1
MSVTRLVKRYLILLGLLSLSLPSFANTSIDELHQAYRSGEATVEQTVAGYIAKINALNPDYNAVIAIDPTALAQAKTLDNAFKQGKWLGALHGIPVLLKDNIAATAVPTTAGSLALQQNLATDDAFVVAKLRAAGAVILGKTNLSEWANFRSSKASSGWSSVGGQTHNAIDPTRNPCGSSSGSAVAVALDLAPVSLGTETDGSITCPASANGVYAIKPPMGLISRSGVVPLAHSQDTVGPMANNLQDALTVMAVIAGYDQHDSASQNPESASYQSYQQHIEPTAIKNLRIGALNSQQFTPMTHKLFGLQQQQLQQAGANIIAVTLPESMAQQIGQMFQDEFFILLYEFKRDLNQYLSQTPSQVRVKSLEQLITFNRQHAQQTMPYFGQDILQQAQAIDLEAQAADYLAAKTRYRDTASQVLTTLYTEHDLDVLISPTLSPAWKTDVINGDHFQGSVSSYSAISGSAHITLPVGKAYGLPIGLSVLAAPKKGIEAIAATSAIDKVLSKAALDITYSSKSPTSSN